MAFQYTKKRFSRTGRGITQVPQLDDAGNPILEDGKPVIGNEQFLADQIVEDSVKGMDFSEFCAAALEAAGGNEETFKSDWLKGANHRLRQDAGGYSPLETAARKVQKALGCTMEEAIALAGKFVS
jgi:hypothetical protein